MRSYLAALTIAVAAAITPAIANAETISGTARIVDGDSLVIDGARIRLIGIDAFEASQNVRRDAMRPAGDRLSAHAD